MDGFNEPILRYPRAQKDFFLVDISLSKKKSHRFER